MKLGRAKQALTPRMAGLIRGMLKRSDSVSDIAGHFGISTRKVGDVSHKRAFPDVAAIRRSRLPALGVHSASSEKRHVALADPRTRLARGRAAGKRFEGRVIPKNPIFDLELGKETSASTALRPARVSVYSIEMIIRLAAMIGEIGHALATGGDLKSTGRGQRAGRKAAARVRKTPARATRVRKTPARRARKVAEPVE